MTIAQGQIGLLADYATSIVKRDNKGLFNLFYLFFSSHTYICTSLKCNFSPLLIMQHIPLWDCVLHVVTSCKVFLLAR